MKEGDFERKQQPKPEARRTFDVVFPDLPLADMKHRMLNSRAPAGYAFIATPQNKILITEQGHSYLANEYGVDDAHSLLHGYVMYKKGELCVIFYKASLRKTMLSNNPEERILVEEASREAISKAFGDMEAK